MRVIAIAASVVMLAGCSFLTPAPALPELPAGAETLAGDWSNEEVYDLSVGRLREQFASHDISLKDYWLTEPTTAEAVFAPYDDALAGWTIADVPDARGRWVARRYENGGRLVVVAVFPAAEFGTPHDALVVIEGQ